MRCELLVLQVGRGRYQIFAQMVVRPQERASPVLRVHRLPHLPSLKSLLASSKTSVSLLLEGLSMSSLFSEDESQRDHRQEPGIERRSVRYSRCTALIRSRYLLRNSLLSLRSLSLFCESLGWNEKSPCWPSFGCSSAILRPSDPF